LTQKLKVASKVGYELDQEARHQSKRRGLLTHKLDTALSGRCRPNLGELLAADSRSLSACWFCR